MADRWRTDTRRRLDLVRGSSTRARLGAPLPSLTDSNASCVGAFAHGCVRACASVHMGVPVHACGPVDSQVRASWPLRGAVSVARRALHVAYRLATGFDAVCCMLRASCRPAGPSPSRPLGRHRRVRGSSLASILVCRLFVCLLVCLFLPLPLVRLCACLFGCLFVAACRAPRRAPTRWRGRRAPRRPRARASRLPGCPIPAAARRLRPRLSPAAAMRPQTQARIPHTNRPSRTRRSARAHGTRPRPPPRGTWRASMMTARSVAESSTRTSSLRALAGWGSLPHGGREGGREGSASGRGVSPSAAQLVPQAELNPPVPAQKWAGRAQSGAVVAGLSPVPAQTWAGLSPVPAQRWAVRAQSRCRCRRGEPSPNPTVAGVQPVPF